MIENQNGMALMLKASIKDHLYANSPLRNKFQIRPIDVGEVKFFINEQYAVMIEEDKTSIKEICNVAFVVPIFQIDSTVRCEKNVKDKFNTFDKMISIELLARETVIYEKLEKYLIEGKKGILMMMTDVQVLVSNSAEGNDGFFAYEQIGAVIVNK
jgi:hypothetical protein